eukprot:scaffold871_cov130-Cylindrotheca_fusiformis.AAC.36
MARIGCIWILFQFLPTMLVVVQAFSRSSICYRSNRIVHRMSDPEKETNDSIFATNVTNISSEQDTTSTSGSSRQRISFYNDHNHDGDDDQDDSRHGGGLPLPLHSSVYTQVLSTTNLPIAKDLRQFYDEHFQDPREPNANRFVWDPWYVSVGDGKQQQDKNDNDEYDPMLLPGEADATKRQTQYSLKRIQTSQFFDDDDLYDRLVEELVELGRSVGLTALTPPWTSMYTEGDLQNFHTDSNHGPLAFVLSLSREGDFEGGETIMMQPQILDYWKGFDGTQGMECGSIIRHIPPFPLGRCIAFDPRIPHGVNRITGNGQNPQKARVVIHGWFSEPQACWFGPWASTTTTTVEEEDDDNSNLDDDDDDDTTIASDREELLDQALQPLVETLASGEIGRVVGYLAVQLVVNADGSIQQVLSVCDTLRADPEDFRGIIGYDESERPVMEDAVADVRLSTFETLKDMYFEEGKKGRSVVVPFEFM